MAEHIFAISMLIIFLARDIQLLTTGGEWSLRTRLLLYGVLESTFVAFLLIVWPSFAAGDLCRILKSPFVWPVSLALHFAGGLACLMLRRRGQHKAWTIALVPSPILLFSLISLAPLSWKNVAYLLVILTWVLLVSMGVFLTNRQLRDETESAFVVEFAGVSNAAMLALVPVLLFA